MEDPRPGRRAWLRVRPWLGGCPGNCWVGSLWVSRETSLRGGPAHPHRPRENFSLLWISSLVEGLSQHQGSCLSWVQSSNSLFLPPVSPQAHWVRIRLAKPGNTPQQGQSSPTSKVFRAQNWLVWKGAVLSLPEEVR